MHERELMENIQNFVVTLVCGETGSGKSTQLPQFINNMAKTQPWKFRIGSKQADQDFVSPPCIGVTQPRRVAAVSLAQRVAEESKTGAVGKGEVGY